ncbi:MucBP domain-containing protein [Pediococcus acidilactici]|nr:cell surface protein [Pediococcus acidilactici]KAF0515961.1 cell surface protein [Pediococcus acidilactici]MCT3037463.1 cell surface protein [Pediococcus acidilactici]QQC45629.1 MucBP domain-containing protein [Pediococcus acidilactici]RJF53697.1 cell surface protein [Pediococcus acidilactici]
MSGGFIILGTNHYQRFYNYGRKWFITSLVGVTIGLNVMLSPISVAASDQVSKSTYPASSPQIAPQEAASRPPRLDYWGSSASAIASSSADPHHYFWGNKHHHHHWHHHCHATVSVRYVDQSGHLLGTGQAYYPHGPHVGEPYVSQPRSIKNYRLVGTAPDSLPTRGRLNKDGDNGMVTYIYAPIYHFKAKTINETIHYVDKNGQTVAPTHVAQPITFVTVDNLAEHVTKNYFSNTSTNFQMDDQGNPRDSENWHSGTQATFAEVPDPLPHGYQLTDPAKDVVPAAPVTPSSTDLNITVRYQLKKKTAVIRWIDDRTGKIVSFKTVNVDVKHPQANLTETFNHQDYRLVSSDLPQGPLTFDEIKESGHLYEVHLRSQTPPVLPAAIKPTPSEMPSSSQPVTPPALVPEEQHPTLPVSPLRRATPAIQPAVAERHPQQPSKSLSNSSSRPRPAQSQPRYPVHAGTIPLAVADQQPTPVPDLLARLDLKWYFPRDNYPVLAFDDWNNHVQKIIKLNGDTKNHTQLGQVWYKMSGRLVMGQRVFGNPGNS